MTGALDKAQIINYDDIDIGKEIGVGGFAIVYKGVYDGKEVAVKQLSIVESAGDASFSEYFAEFRREVWLMSGLDHPNIVILLGVVNKPLCMILEFCSGGDLYGYVHNAGPVTNANSMKEREKYALDVAQGMMFLHSTNPPIIHRDLKTPNILMAADTTGPYPWVAKIADFGLSRGLVWSDNLSGKVVDNPVWLAPEVMLKKPYSEKVDVYAFGVIMWELISGADFFGEEEFMANIQTRICAGEREIVPMDDFIPYYYSELLQICWDNNPDVRPSFRQCIEKINSQDIEAGGFAEEGRAVNIDITFEDLVNAAEEGKSLENYLETTKLPPVVIQTNPRTRPTTIPVTNNIPIPSTNTDIPSSNTSTETTVPQTQNTDNTSDELVLTLNLGDEPSSGWSALPVTANRSKKLTMGERKTSVSVPKRGTRGTRGIRGFRGGVRGSISAKRGTRGRVIRGVRARGRGRGS
eukprot:TRINITY_DN6924_c0_g1_i2.p1 TRINITY_DN6924_c0_g1~~TRINITY_DN6924_c0_g1_i2.p1  ORF type:complete len:466 (+),score=106.76 TRINITY_DN6924_c0_g1_i2:1345-2742(+)